MSRLRFKWCIITKMAANQLLPFSIYIIFKIFNILYNNLINDLHHNLSPAVL